MYVIIFLLPLVPSFINIPDLANPTVESTEIIVDPTGTWSKDFVLPGIVNVPSIKSLSSNPTNNESL